MAFFSVRSHRAVVFGTGDDDRIRSTDGIAEGLRLRRYALRLDVGVKHWDRIQVEERRLHSPIRRLVEQVLQELEVPRLSPQASAYAEDFHGVLSVGFARVMVVFYNIDGVG